MTQALAYVPLRRENFAATVDGAQTGLYTIANRAGMQVSFTNLGAKIQQILVPDAQGVLGDVALGYESIAQVQTGQTSLGAFIGRYAGRIAGGRFSLDGREHVLARNSGNNTLHGGTKGSRLRVFSARQLDASSCELLLDYADGEEHFPGKVRTRVIYSVTEDNALEIAYEAQSDAPTVVNFTSHGFFNLAGQGCMNAQTLDEHILTIAARNYTPIDANLIPTGAIAAVAGTPLDFTQPIRVGARLGGSRPEFKDTHGYDHNWVLDKAQGSYGLAATLDDPLSGRRMEVLSTEPGLVFYGGNNLAGESPRDIGKGGEAYGPRAGLCLEPGHFPDSPNQASFPSTVLRPGQTYRGRITYRFSVTR
jgi:aldose 1-epimerase